MPQSRSVLSLAAAAAVTCLVSAVLIPTQAQASGWPAHPTGIHVTAVTGSSFTVSMDKAANTRNYRVYASTVHSDVFYDNLKAGRHPSTLHWATTTVPRVTVSGLPYTTKPYYWRVETFTGSSQSYGAGIYTRGLRPSTPTGLAVHASSVGGTYLTWSAGGATGFVVQRARNSAFTSGVATFTIRGSNHQFTPYSLGAGQTYWFRIRAVNHNSYSGYGTPASGVKAKREQSVLTMTYNILQSTSDGNREPGGTVSPWSQRRTAAASLLKSTNPDVIAVQEAWPWIGAESSHVRQVDSLRSALSAIGAHYAVAHTENVYGQTDWHRYGNYVVYNTDRYKVVGTPWHWNLPYSNVAAYAELQNKSTGAKFLFVSAHLTASSGRTYDDRRVSQTNSLVSQASSLAGQLRVPVIYGGDFNSNPEQHPLDGPNQVMRSNLIADSRLVAQARYNERYDSMNELVRAPWRYSLFIDYVYAPPGVAVTSWGMSMRLSAGKYVGTIPSDHNPVWARVRIPY